MVSYWAPFILCKLCLALSNIEGKNFIWLSSAKGILNECGLAYIWNTQTFQNTEWLKLNIKQTQRDQFIQLWLSLIQNSPKALNYRIFKEQFETENYLHILDDNFLFEFCKFRTLNHKLPIKYGRWHNIARNMRFCNLCNRNEIGDECHYILECNFFNSIRKDYIDTYFIKRPSAIKFGHLMKTKNKLNLTKFADLSKLSTKLCAPRAKPIATFFSTLFLIIISFHFYRHLLS